MHARVRVIIAVGALLTSGLVASARAEPFLRGPHPFRSENALALHSGFAAGFGDTFTGIKAAVDYGYKIDGSLWLEIHVGALSGGCRQTGAGNACDKPAGDAADVLAGIGWRFQTEIPLVPYAKIATGLIFLFPEAAGRAVGLALRSAVGAKYFLYEWLGVGAEIGLGVGRASYAEGSPIGRGLTFADFALGAEVQF